MALDTRGFFIDTPPPNQGVMQLSDTVREIGRDKKERAYRKEKNEEADEWRKLNLIQDLTDISKHQTSSDVANAIGNQKAAEVLQEFTAAAKTMSPAELQAKVSQKMSGLVSGLTALKNELDISDEMVKQLKQTYPGINAGEAAKTMRGDILGRRIDKDNNFINPLSVMPSGIDFSDPEYLADFVTGNKNLVTSITDPKGTEQESVLMGKQGDYTKFEGKLPFWKQPTYDRDKFNAEGFYTEKEIPSLKIKASALPTDALPSSNGKPFEIVDKDVYDRFAQDSNTNLELIKATKETFPDYKNFNPQEKEYAKRHVLLNQLKTYDQSQLHPTSNVRPQRINVSTGGKPSKSEIIANTPINLSQYQTSGDYYNITKLAPGIKVTGLPTGKSYAAKEILFNPDTKEIEYTDVQGNKEKVDFDTFRQNIATINTGVDLSFIDRLKVTGRPGAKKEEPKPDNKRPPLGSFIKQ